MAIALVAGTEASDSLAAAITTWDTTYDAGATSTDTVLVVIVASKNDNPEIGYTVEYDGVGLTSQISVSHDPTNENASRQETFTLTSPATGSNTLRIVSDNTGKQIGYSAAVFSGVDGTAPVGNTDTNGTPTITAKVAIDFDFDSADSLAVWGVCDGRSYASPWVPEANNTELTDYAEPVPTTNGGIAASSGYRGPEVSSGTYEVGSTLQGTPGRSSVGLVAIELLTAGAGPSGRIMSSLAGAGGLAMRGGIAGTGGGLAG